MKTREFTGKTMLVPTRMGSLELITNDDNTVSLYYVSIKGGSISLCGHAASLEEINKVAETYNIRFIESTVADYSLRTKIA